MSANALKSDHRAKAETGDVIAWNSDYGKMAEVGYSVEVTIRERLAEEIA